MEASEIAERVVKIIAELLGMYPQRILPRQKHSLMTWAWIAWM